MITPETLKEMLSRMVVASAVDDGVRVSTHVLYPSNGAVAVTVRGGEIPLSCLTKAAQRAR